MNSTANNLYNCVGMSSGGRIPNVLAAPFFADVPAREWVVWQVDMRYPMPGSDKSRLAAPGACGVIV
jgi:hypothetical protein